jgi:hypothetical protein
MGRAIAKPHTHQLKQTYCLVPKLFGLGTPTLQALLDVVTPSRAWFVVTPKQSLGVRQVRLS